MLIRISLILFILVGIYLWVRQVLYTEQDNQKMEKSLEVIQQSCTAAQGRIDEARKYRHDIPKHLHMMEEVMSGRKDNQYCSDPMLNTIACMEEEKCRKNNISMSIDFCVRDAEFLKQLNIKSVDLSGIIQNLLDNAVEECCRIPEEREREIIWILRETSGGMNMQIENTCKNVKTIDFTTKKEDKKAHGWGTKIIKETLGASEGTIEYIKKDADRICATVFIPFREDRTDREAEKAF